MSRSTLTQVMTRTRARLTLLLAASCIAPAMSAPPPIQELLGPSMTKLRSPLDNANGSACLDPSCSRQAGFGAQVFETDGVRQGSVSVVIVENGVFAFMSCFGVEYANSVVVTPGNGNATVHMTIDPASPACGGFNVFAPIAINLVGQPNGVDSFRQRGTNQIESSGTSFKSNFTNNGFSATFNGTIGSISGPFMGVTQASQTFDRTRVK